MLIFSQMFHLRALYSTWHNAGMVQVVNIHTSISWKQNTTRNSERMQRRRLVKLQTKVCLPQWQFVGHDANCLSGGDCPFGDECVYGHSCPNGTTCYYLKLGKCKFVAGEASRDPRSIRNHPHLRFSWYAPPTEQLN